MAILFNPLKREAARQVTDMFSNLSQCHDCHNFVLKMEKLVRIYRMLLS